MRCQRFTVVPGLMALRVGGVVGMTASVKVCGRRPRARGATVMGPASENLHRSGHTLLVSF